MPADRTRILRGVGAALVFVGLMAAIRFVLQAEIGSHPPPGPIPPTFALWRELTYAAMALAATAVMAWIERRPPWDYGLRGPRLAQGFGLGCLTALGCLCAMMAALHAGGFVAFDGVALQAPAAMLGYGVVWFLVFGLVGFTEEVLFRGYLQAALTRALGFWTAAGLTSAVFALAHVSNAGMSVLGLAGTFLGGMALCLVLRASGSLWPGIGLHTAFDWGESYLFGTRDSGLIMKGHLLATHAVGDARFSGGATGPEASVLAMPIMIASALLLAALLRRTLWRRPDAVGQAA